MVQLHRLAVPAFLVLGTSVYGAPTAGSNGLPFDEAILQAALAHPESFGAPEAIEPEMSLFAAASTNYTTFEPSEVSGGNSEDLSKRSILGPDNRVYWPNSDYPYRAMGRIEISTGQWCSASLLGSRIVATARHCVLDNASFRFQPAYDNGERLGGSPVTGVIKYPVGQTGSCAVTYDWALFIIQDRLGDANGYLGAKAIDPNTQLNRAMFFQYGYPQDKGGRQPYRQEAIKALFIEDCEPISPIRTDADSVGGQSGSPFWLLENGSRYQYGIHTGSTDQYSVLAGGIQWLNAIGQARRDFP